MKKSSAIAFESNHSVESNLIFNIEPFINSFKNLVVVSTSILKVSRQTGNKVFFIESWQCSEPARPSGADFLRSVTPKNKTHIMDCFHKDATALLEYKDKLPSYNTSSNPFESLELERKLVQDLILQKCRKLCTKNEKSVTGLQIESGEVINPSNFDFSDLEHREYSELPWIAEKSAEHSRKVQAYLINLPASAVRVIVEVMKNHIGHFICSCYGCYLPRDLVLISQEFKQFSETYSLKNLHYLLPNKFAGHILRTLAEDPVCCKKFLQKCEEKVHIIMKNLQSVLVLATFIKKAPDEDCLAFLISELEGTSSLTSESLILRTLTNLIDRLSGNYLKRVVRIINQHMAWLVDDSLGNFGVQALIRKKVPSTIERFKRLVYESSIVALFVNKHRKFVFLEALRSFGDDREFFMHILKELMMNTSSLRLLFKYEDSAWLLIALLANLHQNTNNKILKKVSRRISRVAEETIHGDMYKFWITIKRHLDLFISNEFCSIISESPGLNPQSSIHSA